eukprot:g5297.t1
MKTSFRILVCCLAFCVASSGAIRIERSLKQSSVSVVSRANCVIVNGRCQSRSRVDTRASSAVAESISAALAVAEASARSRADVDASADAFAQAIAVAAAEVISSHVAEVLVQGGRGRGCASTNSFATASAQAMAIAVSEAFSRSENAVSRAAAECFSEAVAEATVTAVQRARFGTCTTAGVSAIQASLRTVRYAEAIATAFSSVYTAIRDGDAVAGARCEASAISNTFGFDRGVFRGVFGK